MITLKNCAVYNNMLMVYRGVRACALSYFRNWEPARMEGEREKERRGLRDSGI